MYTLPLQPACVRIGARVSDRAAAIRLLVDMLAAAGALQGPDAAAALEREVLAREALAPTDVGRGTAIPHAKCDAVARPVLAALTLDPPLPAAPGGPVAAGEDSAALRMVFLLAVPAAAHDEHVQMLGALATALRDDTACAAMLAAKTPARFITALQQGAAAPPADAPPPVYRVLAVTACPTGIAHTYMAREALLDEARRMGVALKVETNGASGVQDPLTDAEIENAECIIIAADRAVETKRFAGKPVIRVPVSEAIRRPEQLLHQALSATAPDFEPPMPDLFTPGASLPARLRGLAHRMYAHLMSGISRMLPFVTGGGILIALSYLLTGAGPITEHEFGLTGILYNVGQACFGMMYVVLAGFIASSIGDIAAFVPGALGGYMAYVGMTGAAETEWVSSGFWGALIAGFGAGLLLKGFGWLGNRLPHTLDQIKVMLLYPAVGLLCIALFMVYIVNPYLGRFNDWVYVGLTDLHGGSRLVLCAALGGLMAIDYGGPVNKAAYVFGTMALMNDQPDLMAAVMIGGMTPPIGIAVACLLFPNRFTRAGRRTAPTNLVLGASFVTEGALPFALRDPLRVIPCCFVGSTLAGTLCQWLGCAVPAPHGGLFLLPVMTEPLGFLAALAAGSLTTTLLLGLVKKPMTEGQRFADIPVPVIVDKPLTPTL